MDELFGLIGGMVMDGLTLTKKIRFYVLAVSAVLLLAFSSIAPASAVKVGLNKRSLELEVGETFTLKVKGTKKKPKWKSKDKSVATVNQKGKVVAKEEGITYIIATIGKKRYQCKVTVVEVPSEEEVYSKIIALKERFPNGTPWGNDVSYDFKGGIYGRGYGCAGFAFMLSDEAFGELPARILEDYNQIRVGDILRVNNDSHSVVVLEVKSDGIVVAEGNYNDSVLWEREISNEELQQSFTYLMTRYPD